MKAISHFVVRVFDLIEAEGRSLLTVARGEAQRAQATVASMAMAAAFLFVAVLLCVGGCWLLGSGLMWWLETQVSRPAAACLTGLVAILVSGVCAFTFRALAWKQQP